MDYDETAVPEVYDTARAYGPGVMALWLERILTLAPKDDVADVLDLGCGTGRYSFTLSRAYDARVTGLDPSEKMLAEARRKAADRRVIFQQGTGEALPLADASVDLAFLSMVLHHLSDPRRTASELYRVLRPAARVCLRNSMAEEIDSYPQIRFFPGYRSLLEERLLTRAELAATFRTAGFVHEAQQVVPHPMATGWPELADKLQGRADSFLASLPDEAFAAGMAALREHARDAAGGTVTLNIDLFVFRRNADST